MTGYDLEAPPSEADRTIKGKGGVAGDLGEGVFS